jgi:hypothetical protein
VTGPIGLRLDPTTPTAEETVEVVRNHEDGTRSARVEPSPPSARRGDARRRAEAGRARVDAERDVDGGAEGQQPRERRPDESHGRRSEMIRADQER